MSETKQIKRDSTIFYRSFYESAICLPVEERVKLYEAIFEYSLNGKQIELEGVAKSIFILVLPNLEANIKRWESGNKAKRKQNGSKNKAKPKRGKSEAEANKDKDKDVDKDENKDKDENVLTGFFSDNFDASWKKWIDYKKVQHRFKYKAREYEVRAVKELHELSGGNEKKANAIIDRSIANGYKGLVEYHDYKETPTEKPKFVSHLTEADKQW